MNKKTRLLLHDAWQHNQWALLPAAEETVRMLTAPPHSTQGVYITAGVTLALTVALSSLPAAMRWSATPASPPQHQTQEDTGATTNKRQHRLNERKSALMAHILGISLGVTAATLVIAAAAAAGAIEASALWGPLASTVTSAAVTILSSKSLAGSDERWEDTET